MSKQNLLVDLGAMIAQNMVNQFAVLAKKFASFGQPRSSQSGKPHTSAAPAAVVTAKANAEHSEVTQASKQKKASAGPASTVTAREQAGPMKTIATPVESPLATASSSGPIIPCETTLQASCPAPAADPELDALRARVESLEIRVVDLETRKAEMEQLIDEFAFCQYQALGELVGEQLRLQHELLKRRAERSSRPDDQQAAAAAAEEYRAYEQARDNPDSPQVALADGEREELKALYRAAVMRCHPDRVDDAAKSQAHEMFLRTQDAYRRRDLESLRLISRQLAVGDTSPTSNGPTPRERLEGLVNGLLDKGAELLLAIQSIQMQAQYRRARDRQKWEDYFAAARERLEDECNAMRRQLAVC